MEGGKIIIPFLYQQQEIWLWMRKIYNTKHNNPNVRALRTKLLPQQTQVLGNGLILLPFLQVFPLLAIHICCPCARLPVDPPCWTHGVGPDPKMGIYEPTSALPETGASVGQDCVVLATCGGDQALRRGGGGTNTERKEIYSLSLTERWEEAATLPKGKCIYVERKHRSL